MKRLHAGERGIGQIDVAQVGAMHATPMILIGLMHELSENESVVTNHVCTVSAWCAEEFHARDENTYLTCHLFRRAAKKNQRKLEDKNREFKVEWTESFELKIKGWTSELYYLLRKVPKSY
ncbi:hypothetical protein CEXT_715311 [Caerostris extrusa]|uniref:Uncharacterized protein n=1 Tax=Caerostris extrusa TaxID=172846 RepID=A0AAV4WZY5_CAEEX|nr:hypothetical protein CEXT_715311 [Caerostris extrusa]